MTVEKNATRPKELLKGEYNWLDYGRKHGESVFTRFFQNYYPPVKFNFDKRRAHYSSLICSGQMTRKEALEKLAEPLYEAHQLDADMNFIAAKLGYSREELAEILALPTGRHDEYPDNARLFALGRRAKTIQNFLKLLAGGDFQRIRQKLLKRY